MYRNMLIMLACALISAPAFAQSSDFSRYAQLPPCPDKLTYRQAPCSNLQWNPSPPSPRPTLDPRVQIEAQKQKWTERWDERDRYRWRDPPKPPSMSDTIEKKLELDRRGPTYRDGVPGWRWGPKP
jgi:hypothetical protein